MRGRNDSGGQRERKGAAEPPCALSQERQTAPQRADFRPLSVSGRQNEVFDLSAGQVQTLYEVGQFRIVSERDLRGALGEVSRGQVQSLAARGLLRHKVISSPLYAESLSLVSLTKRGKQVLDQAFGAKTAQRFYAGFVKPRELRHDTALYRMYQLEAERLRRDGAKLHRVVLDYELKRNVFSALERARRWERTSTRAEIQQRVAARYGLQVVDGKIPLPDLRIEYATAGGESTHVDLELSTEHYKASQRAQKAQAGFRVYRLRTGAGSMDSRAGGTPNGQDIVLDLLF